LIRSKLLFEESHNGEVVHLVLNSPDNLNAMDLEMADAFREATARVKERTECRAVVIRGLGRAFSAGGDLEMLRLKVEKSEQQNEREMMDFYLSFLGLRDLVVPLVCALHGHVVGAGFCFAAACDIRLADSSTLLAAPFARLALHPGMGGSYFLAKALGSGVARELMLTGRRMTAQEALQRGFVTSVSEPNDRLDELDRLLGRLLRSSPQATRALLQTEREAQSTDVAAALAREAREQARCYARSEFLAGVTALQNKQRPPWAPDSGRGEP
jgi:enoyl-CoA hydratase